MKDKIITRLIYYRDIEEERSININRTLIDKVI